MLSPVCKRSSRRLIWGLLVGATSALCLPALAAAHGGHEHGFIKRPCARIVTIGLIGEGCRQGDMLRLQPAFAPGAGAMLQTPQPSYVHVAADVAPAQPVPAASTPPDMRYVECVTAPFTASYYFTFVYARSTTAPLSYAQAAAQIRHAAGDAATTIHQQVQRFSSGLEYRLRVRCDGDGQIHVADLPLSMPQDQVSFGAMQMATWHVSGLSNPRTNTIMFSDRPNLPWFGMTAAGIASMDPTDDRYMDGGQHAGIFGAYWGDRRVVLHEMFHTIGAVRDGAPNSPGTGHCTDGYDLMCYNEGVGWSTPCFEAMDWDFDCGGDDYFNVHPAPGSWLDQNLNLAIGNPWFSTQAPGDTTPPTIVPQAQPQWLGRYSRPPFDMRDERLLARVEYSDGTNTYGAREPRLLQPGLIDLPAGERNLTITAIDVAGNRRSSGPWPFRIDLTAPELRVDPARTIEARTTTSHYRTRLLLPAPSANDAPMTAGRWCIVREGEMCQLLGQSVPIQQISAQELAQGYVDINLPVPTDKPLANGERWSVCWSARDAAGNEFMHWDLNYHRFMCHNYHTDLAAPPPPVQVNDSSSIYEADADYMRFLGGKGSALVILPQDRSDIAGSWVCMSAAATCEPSDSAIPRQYVYPYASHAVDITIGADPPPDGQRFVSCARTIDAVGRWSERACSDGAVSDNTDPEAISTIVAAGAEPGSLAIIDVKAIDRLAGMDKVTVSWNLSGRRCEPLAGLPDTWRCVFPVPPATERTLITTYDNVWNSNYYNPEGIGLGQAAPAGTVESPLADGWPRQFFYGSGGGSTGSTTSTFTTITKPVVQIEDPVQDDIRTPPVFAASWGRTPRLVRTRRALQLTGSVSIDSGRLKRCELRVGVRRLSCRVRRGQALLRGVLPRHTRAVVVRVTLVSVTGQRLVLRKSVRLRR